MTADRTRLTIEYVDPTKLSLHPDNPRQGDIGAIYESIQHNGVYTPVVAQESTGRIIIGNHRYQAMVETGIDQIPVIWREVDDQAAVRIMLADNRSTDLASNDEAKLIELLQSLPDLGGVLYDDDDLSQMLAFQAGFGGANDQKYVRHTDVPQYEPTEAKPPPLDELTDRTKTRKLEEAIRLADIPAGVADFLTVAAQRHVRFNYAEIAEYYAHAPAPIQALMEASALVIIDVDDAIRHGFTTLEATLAHLRDEDRVERGHEIEVVPDEPIELIVDEDDA